MNRQDIGFPEVANLYRTKEKALYPTKTYLLPRSDIIPLGEDNAFYKGWMDYNRRALMDKIHNAQQSVKRNLEPRYPQLPKSGTKAQVFFGVHNDDMEMIREHSNKNKMSGGGLKFSDSTAGTDLNRVEREKQRIRIINRLRKDFEGEPTIEQPPEAEDLSMGREADEKLQFDLLVSSITEKLLNGIVDGSVYRDLLQVAQYLIKNIWKFNDFDFFQNFEDSLNELTSIIFGVIQGYERNTLGNFYSRQSLQYAKPTVDLVARLLDYVQLNSTGIGRDEKYRKSLAKSSIKGFKQTINEASKEFEENFNIDVSPEEGEMQMPDLEEAQAPEQEPPPPVGGRKCNPKARSRLVKLYK
jgi:hypothetical protein